MLSITHIMLQRTIRSFILLFNNEKMARVACKIESMRTGYAAVQDAGKNYCSRFFLDVGNLADFQQ